MKEGNYLKFEFEIILEQPNYYYLKWNSNLGTTTKPINKSDIPMPDISKSNKVEFNIDGDPIGNPFEINVISQVIVEIKSESKK